MFGDIAGRCEGELTCAHPNAPADGGSDVTEEVFVGVAHVLLSAELPHLFGTHPAAATAVQDQTDSWRTAGGCGGAGTLTAALLTGSLRRWRHRGTRSGTESPFSQELLSTQTQTFPENFKVVLLTACEKSKQSRGSQMTFSLLANIFSPSGSIQSFLNLFGKSSSALKNFWSSGSGVGLGVSVCCPAHRSPFLSWWKLEFSFSTKSWSELWLLRGAPLYRRSSATRHWGLNGEPALDKHGHTWHSFLASWPPLQTSHIPAVWRQGSAVRLNNTSTSKSGFHLE